jgi:N-acetylglucosamine kinase-like BadF-type ATPase
MTQHYLGIDVGSTKTHALIADGSGRVVGFGAGGAGNPEGVGYEGLAAALQDAAHGAFSDAGIAPGEVLGAGLGIAGYDWPSQRPDMFGAIDTIGLSCPTEIVNDAMLGVLAGAREGWGVSVVSGTSCNCWGRTLDGREGRMVGFSWLGEYSGSGEIVAEALKAIGRAWTMRAPATALTQAFVEDAGVATVEEFLERISTAGPRPGAAAAPLVFRVAAEGDEVALGLVRWAGRELADMAIGVVNQLGIHGDEFETVLAGSFFKGSPLLQEVMSDEIRRVAPGAALVRLHAPPAVGAVVLGMQQAGLRTAPVREALVACAEAVLETEEE